MSQLHDEKDDPSTSTQKTLDIFFRSSNSNSNVNGINGRITNTSGQDNDSTSLTTKEYLVPDAGTGVSTDQRQDFFLHDESCFIPEQRSLGNYSNESVLSNPLGGTKLDDVSSSAKVCLK